MDRTFTLGIHRKIFFLSRSVGHDSYSASSATQISRAVPLAITGPGGDTVSAGRHL